MVGGKTQRGGRLGRSIAVCAIVAGSTTIASGSAAGQVAGAELRLTQTASPTAAEPGQTFTFFLKYSCSTVACLDARIVATLPAEAELVQPDPFSGNYLGTPAVSGREVTFTLAQVLQAGNTADIAIRMEFPPGTPVMTKATNNAWIRASNAARVDANPATVEALAASRLTLEKRLAPGQVPKVDTPVTYRLTLRVAAGSTQDILNPRLEDALQAGVEFVAATQGGAYDPATRRVTWPLPTLVPNPLQDVVISRDVTVRYPTPTFAVGQAVINTARCVGTPAGRTEQELATDTFAGTLKPPGSITAASKRATTTALGPGQSDRFTVSGSNPNAEPLTGFEILDNLPAALTTVADGQPNVTGGGTPPVLAWRPEGGAFQPLATAVSGGGWQATAPAATDELRASYGTVAAGFSASFVVRAGIPASGLGRDGNPVVPLSVIANCARVSATNATPRFACTNQTATPIVVTFTKALASAAQVLPGDTVSWDMALGVAAASAADLVDPVVTDCLPAGLDLVDTASPASSANGSAPEGFPAPVITRGTCGAGQVQITWAWTGPASFTVPRGASGTIRLLTRVAAGVAPGTLTNVATLTATNLTDPREQRDDVTVTSTTLLVGTKRVTGSDGVTASAEGTAHTTPGGPATFHLTVTNTSQVPATNIVLIDTFGHPGDQGVLTTSGRDSSWAPVFRGPVVTSIPAKVLYSRSSNPCPTELGATKAGCDLKPGWTATMPSPASAVGSVMVDYGTAVLGPQQSVVATYDMTAPTATTSGTSWNSFGFAGIRADNREALAPAEPDKVGLVVRNPVPSDSGISIVKRINGIYAPNPPGAFIPDGTPIEFTYVVTNTGSTTLVGLTVVDDQLGPISCPTTTLAPGESITCRSATLVLKPGSYVNRVEAVAAPATGGGAPLLGTSQTYFVIYLRSQSGLTLQKLVNGEHVPNPPGLNIAAGQPVEFTYVVTNTGQVDLAGLTLLDDRLGGIACPSDQLATGESMTCRAPMQKAILGPYQNTAVVTGRVAGTGSPIPPVGDRGNYYNQLPLAGSSTMEVVGAGVALVGGGFVLLLASRLRRRPRAAA